MCLVGHSIIRTVCTICDILQNMEITASEEKSSYPLLLLLCSQLGIGNNVPVSAIRVTRSTRTENNFFISKPLSHKSPPWVLTGRHCESYILHFALETTGEIQDFAASSCNCCRECSRGKTLHYEQRKVLANVQAQHADVPLLSTIVY